MTISEALKKYSQIEADLLLGHVLNKGKEFLYMHGEKKLTALQQKKFETMTAKRKKGMPVAYLLGYKYFYGLKFKVTPNVLIPRPESEWLVEEVLRLTKSKPKVKILDVGTGSGAIAISIAKSSKARVFASDISAKALSVAKANAKANNVKVSFIKSDLLKEVKGKFDIIIANLPYVPISDYKNLLKNLKFEPKLALTDGRDDFRLVLNLVEQAKDHLSPQGTLLLEVDPKSFKYLEPYQPKAYRDINRLCRFAVINFK